jgi:hypothetical protein
VPSQGRRSAAPMLAKCPRQRRIELRRDSADDNRPTVSKYPQLWHARDLKLHSCSDTCKSACGPKAVPGQRLLTAAATSLVREPARMPRYKHSEADQAIVEREAPRRSARRATAQRNAARFPFIPPTTGRLPVRATCDPTSRRSRPRRRRFLEIRSTLARARGRCGRLRNARSPSASRGGGTTLRREA